MKRAAKREPVKPACASSLEAGASEDSRQEASIAAEAPSKPSNAVVSPAVHKCMVGNKGKNTSPELLVRSRLREEGLVGYRLHWRVPGHPDIAYPGKKVAIFVNGCFWHRCPHCNPSTPKTNQEYWIPKFARNVERDRRNIELLEAEGWKVHVVWECELKKKRVEYTFMKLLPQLHEELGK